MQAREDGVQDQASSRGFDFGGGGIEDDNDNEAAALNAPGRFGRLLLESPSLYAHDNYLLHRAENFKTWPERIFIDVGKEQEPIEDVDKLDGILPRDGLGPARLRVRRSEGAAHNPDAWASRFPEALHFLYGTGNPGPTRKGRERK